MRTLILLALAGVMGVTQEVRVEGDVLMPLRVTPRELGRTLRKI